MKKVTYIDLFAGMGGMRLGFSQACAELGITAECLFTSEIKPHALRALTANFAEQTIHGDICAVEAHDIRDFDYLLAGFPCQAFSYAGRRRGFDDTRGTLFFEVARILAAKCPRGFILENVEGLVTHDRVAKGATIGRTLETILQVLQDLGYHVTWKVINAADVGIAQQRKRIYILGSRDKKISINVARQPNACLADVLEQGQPCSEFPMIRDLLQRFTAQELEGKSLNDKRGGPNNIHSWDLGLRGRVTPEQRTLLEQILLQRRKRCWAEQLGVPWRDGQPLTLEQIQSFNSNPNLITDLEALVRQGYLRLKPIARDLNTTLTTSSQDLQPQLCGYSISTGRLSFPVHRILNSSQPTPTLVATDLQGIFVADGAGLRNLTLRECLRLFGYPEDYQLEMLTTSQAYDLLGNTVVVPVIRKLARNLLQPL